MKKIYKTSCSDNNIYPKFCAQVAKSEELFQNFRRDEIYTSVVETVLQKDGNDYLKRAIDQTPGLKKYMKKFNAGDSIGNPIVYKYRFGMFSPRLSFSPTTLRYIKVLSDLKKYFGNLDNMDILEIGVGYGGQCKIIADVFNFRSYTMIDLDPVIELSKKYLSKVGLKKINFIPLDLIPKRKNYDLFISNYAFSEVRRDLQEIYLSRYIENSRMGYMLCNFKTHTWDKDQYSELELLNLIKDSTSLKSNPYLTDLEINCNISLIMWNQQ